MAWSRHLRSRQLPACLRRSNRRGGHPYLGGSFPCYNVYQTKDGRYMALGALESHFWVGFCEAIGREDLVSRQFPDGTERASVIAEIQRVFLHVPGQSGSSFSSDKDVCCEPVNTIEEALTHSPGEARGARYSKWIILLRGN